MPSHAPTTVSWVLGCLCLLLTNPAGVHASRTELTSTTASVFAAGDRALFIDGNLGGSVALGQPANSGVLSGFRVSAIGGFNSVATGSGSGVFATHSSVAGGGSATVLGGYFGNAPGDASSAIGGFLGVAGGDFSVVLGGDSSEALSPTSVAFGTACKIDGSEGNMIGGSCDATPWMYPSPTFHYEGEIISWNVGPFPSDHRVKKNIRDMAVDDATAVVMGLTPRLYEYEEAYAFSTHQNLPDATRGGFIAQEVEEVLPHAVSTDTNTVTYHTTARRQLNTTAEEFADDGGTPSERGPPYPPEDEPLEVVDQKRLNKDRLFAYVVRVVQDLVEAKEALETRVAELEAQLAGP